MSTKNILTDLKKFIDNYPNEQITRADREFIFRQLQNSIDKLLEPIVEKSKSTTIDNNFIPNKSIVKITSGNDICEFNLETILEQGKEYFKNYKLEQMKNFLKKYSLPSSGKKNDLIDRIIDFAKSSQIKFIDNFKNEKDEKVLSSELNEYETKKIKYKNQYLSKIINNSIKQCLKKYFDNSTEWVNKFIGFSENNNGIFCSIWINKEQITVIKFNISDEGKFVYKNKKENNIYDLKDYDKIILPYHQIK